MQPPPKAQETQATREQSAFPASDELDATPVLSKLDRGEVLPNDGSSLKDRIRRAAYAAAERRGFEPGFEMDDWLEAEKQLADPKASKNPDESDATSADRTTGGPEGTL